MSLHAPIMRRFAVSGNFAFSSFPTGISAAVTADVRSGDAASDSTLCKSAVSCTEDKVFARTIANNLSEVHIPKGFRDHVINLAAQLYAQADGEEISAAISRQTGRPEAIIDWIITGHAIAESRARQTLRLALQEGISESDETAADVQAEPCRIRTPKRKAQREGVA